MTRLFLHTSTLYVNESPRAVPSHPIPTYPPEAAKAAEHKLALQAEELAAENERKRLSLELEMAAVEAAAEVARAEEARLLAEQLAEESRLKEEARQRELERLRMEACIASTDEVMEMMMDHAVTSLIREAARRRRWVCANGVRGTRVWREEGPGEFVTVNVQNAAKFSKPANLSKSVSFILRLSYICS